MVSKQDCPQKENQRERRAKRKQQAAAMGTVEQSFQLLIFTRFARPVRAWVCTAPRTPASLCSRGAGARARSGEVGAADAGARAAASAAAALPADEHRSARAPALPSGGGAGRREDDHGEEREARDGDAEHDVAARDARGHDAGAGLEHDAAACHSQRPLTLSDSLSRILLACSTGAELSVTRRRASGWRRRAARVAGYKGESTLGAALRLIKCGGARAVAVVGGGGQVTRGEASTRASAGRIKPGAPIRRCNRRQFAK
jgi:hypothetical protein